MNLIRTTLCLLGVRKIKYMHKCLCVYNLENSLFYGPKTFYTNFPNLMALVGLSIFFLLRIFIYFLFA